MSDHTFTHREKVTASIQAGDMLREHDLVAGMRCPVCEHKQFATATDFYVAAASPVGILLCSACGMASTINYVDHAFKVAS